MSLKKRRGQRYQKFWNQLVTTYGEYCYYCGDIAMVIDHVVPVVHGGTDDFENLLLSCVRCNQMAYDRVFESSEQKAEYLRDTRSREKKLKHAFCIDCLLPYAYREHSPSLFLCAECYDREYKTSYAQRSIWSEWIKLLKKAGCSVTGHRMARKEIATLNKKSRLRKRDILFRIMEEEECDGEW